MVILRPIPKHNGYYADIYGQIWSANWIQKKMIPLAMSLNDLGYRRVNLKTQRGSKTRSVHTLILLTFCGPKPNGMQCRHLDGVRTNNHIDNLRWGTASENATDKERHGTGSGAWVAKKYCTKKVCINGHKLTPENRNKKGHCRKCKSIWNTAWTKRKRQRLKLERKQT